MLDKKMHLQRYDHRRHAGNAGDVWKHFILVEVAGYLLRKNRSLVYVESHAGFPQYELDAGGEWSGGIGRCWDNLSRLQEFLYFRILFEINGFQLRLYPGSALLVKRAARNSGGETIIKLWDIDHDVQTSWLAGPGPENVEFYLGDGFSGAASVLDHSRPGLLLIDPPYIESQDSAMACELLEAAERAGWVALLWYLPESVSIHCSDPVEKFRLTFKQALLQDDRWKEAEMALVGADNSLKAYLHRRSADLVRVMNKNIFKEPG
jgi:23S rRNA (adenine2030-N6)-methyltransferase